ncbi:MAG: NlpC/P60 family protein [Aeromicrobium sp.]
MSALQPGDLVFYGDMSHDGMYVGKGKVVHAPRPGKSVEITGLSGFSKAGRVG